MLRPVAFGLHGIQAKACACIFTVFDARLFKERGSGFDLFAHTASVWIGGLPPQQEDGVASLIGVFGLERPLSRCLFVLFIGTSLVR